MKQFKKYTVYYTLLSVLGLLMFNNYSFYAFENEGGMDKKNIPNEFSFDSMCMEACGAKIVSWPEDSDNHDGEFDFLVCKITPKEVGVASKIPTNWIEHQISPDPKPIISISDVAKCEVKVNLSDNLHCGENFNIIAYNNPISCVFQNGYPLYGDAYYSRVIYESKLIRRDSVSLVLLKKIEGGDSFLPICVFPIKKDELSFFHAFDSANKTNKNTIVDELKSDKSNPYLLSKEIWRMKDKNDALDVFLNSKRHPEASRLLWFSFFGADNEYDFNSLGRKMDAWLALQLNEHTSVPRSVYEYAIAMAACGHFGNEDELLMRTRPNHSLAQINHTASFFRQRLIPILDHVAKTPNAQLSEWGKALKVVSGPDSIYRKPLVDTSKPVSK